MDIRSRVYQLVEEMSGGRKLSKSERSKIYKKAWAQAKKEAGK